MTVRPMVNRDSQFFWDGTRAGELRIQKCNACGAKRFPPGPACQSCAAYDRGYDVAAGTGTVFSYVVHRHPPVPGKELPLVIALIDLDEGVRMVGEVVDVPDERDRDRDAAAGRLPRGGRRPDPAHLEAGMRALEAGQVLPEWSLPMTPTTIVSTAIATRDWQDVHHDRDIAQAAGSKDIFMNILTTNGLVEKFVVDWAGPDTELKGIAIRLGAPAHPYDTLTFSGTVASVEDGIATIDVVGRVSLGDHVTGKVKVALGVEEGALRPSRNQVTWGWDGPSTVSRGFETVAAQLPQPAMEGQS